MKSPPLIITIDSSGTGRCLYSELIDLLALGKLEIKRASTIEFNHYSQQWEVFDLENNLLFESASRTLCLDWEQDHFNRSENLGLKGPIDFDVKHQPTNLAGKEFLE